MTWFSSAEDRQSVIDLLPEIASPFETFYTSFWQQPYLPAETLELCRLRLAQLHRCEVELVREEVSLSAERRAQLADWVNNPLYSEAEKAALGFTEIYAMDTQAITDELAESVKQHYGDAGLVVLIEALGVLDGITRLSLLWELPTNQSVKNHAGGEA